MKYIILAELDAETGLELESQPEDIQEIINKWQELDPIGMYFSLTDRTLTIIVEAESEKDFFEQLHMMWRLTLDYPVVWPVVSVEEFPEILKRAGIA